ncbi:MAG: hypothetical protein ABIQ15_17065 [Nocardioides sp.]
MSATGPEELFDSPESTGVAAVDEAMVSLHDLDERPVDEHPAVFESVHGALRAVLSGDARV